MASRRIRPPGSMGRTALFETEIFGLEMPPEADRMVRTGAEEAQAFLAAVADMSPEAFDKAMERLKTSTFQARLARLFRELGLEEPRQTEAIQDFIVFGESFNG